MIVRPAVTLLLEMELVPPVRLARTLQQALHLVFLVQPEHLPRIHCLVQIVVMEHTLVLVLHHARPVLLEHLATMDWVVHHVSLV